MFVSEGLVDELRGPNLNRALAVGRGSCLVFLHPPVILVTLVILCVR